MTKLVLISDTHAQFGQIINDLFDIGPADILIHGGDITDVGDMEDLWRFCEQVKKVRHLYKDVIAIAGNHDFNFENNNRTISELALKDANIKYLHDSAIESCGLKIYGSPYQPWFYDWAFNLQRGKPLADKWSLIPDDVDVLITHGPPASILDKVEYFGRDAEYHYEGVGCQDLYNRVSQLKNLKLHVFGHIHESYGQEKIDNEIYVNASICNKFNKIQNKPIVVEL